MVEQVSEDVVVFQQLKELGEMLLSMENPMKKRRNSSCKV
jgi:hypothetical protein